MDMKAGDRLGLPRYRELIRRRHEQPERMPEHIADFFKQIIQTKNTLDAKMGYRYDSRIMRQRLIKTQAIVTALQSNRELLEAEPKIEELIRYVIQIIKENELYAITLFGDEHDVGFFDRVEIDPRGNKEAKNGILHELLNATSFVDYYQQSLKELEKHSHEAKRRLAVFIRKVEDNMTEMEQKMKEFERKEEEFEKQTQENEQRVREIEAKYFDSAEKIKERMKEISEAAKRGDVKEISSIADVEFEEPEEKKETSKRKKFR